MKNKVLLIVAVIVNILIWVNSLMPASISSNQSGIVAEVFFPIFKNIVSYQNFVLIIRKFAHFTEFMILGFLFSFVYKNKKLNKYYLIALIHVIVVAVVDETIQLFVDGRAGLITDVLIDTAGGIFGILSSFLFNKLFSKTI